MRPVMNILGIALIVFGIVAVVFITLNYAINNETAFGPDETGGYAIEGPNFEGSPSFENPTRNADMP